MIDELADHPYLSHCLTNKVRERESLPHSKKCFSEKEEDRGVRRRSKHEVIDALRRGYQAAGRVEKGRLIDEAVAVTGYDRRYAQRLLRGGTP